MAVYVPDTNTFKLSDVVAAVEDHAGNIDDTLSDAFINSIDSYFNSIYKGNKDRLSNFRDYGPNENPTEGTFTLPFPSYGGVRVVGRLVYMSNDGLHLFVVASVMYDPAIVVLFRFDLSVPFDLTTISYHSNRSLGGFPSLYIPRTMRFNSTGTRVMVMADSHLEGDKDPVIRTFVLSPAWNIVSPTSSYDSVLKHFWTTADRRAMRMSFSESGTTAFMYYRERYSEQLNFYNLSTPYTIPSGTVSSNGTNLFMAFGGITNNISGMRVYDTSLSPAKVEVSINNDSSQAQVGLCNINTSTWNANTAWSNQYIFTTFAASDVYSMRGRFLNYILENNSPSSSPLYPRVHCKILLGV